MRFIVTFVPAKGPLLAMGERQPIGLAGLDQIRKANQEINASDVLYKVERKAYSSIATELSEAGARALGVYFQDACEVVVKVHQAKPDDLPLQRFIHLTVPDAKNRLTWFIDPDDVAYSWLLAGAPLLWDSPYAKPDEELFDEPDDEHVYLGESTLAKLREGADNLPADADALLLDGQLLYVSSLVKRLAQDGSTDLWTDLIGLKALAAIDAIDTRIEKIKFLRSMVCCTRSGLTETKDAIDARTHWLKEQEPASPWKDALLNELAREDACIMVSIEYILAGISNDVDFEDVLTTPKVRDLLRQHWPWLSSRQNVVDALPRQWRGFFDSLE